MAVYAILLSTFPLSLTSIFELFVLLSAKYIEWDVNLVPAKVKIINPHVALSTGTMSHLFISREAFQRDRAFTVSLVQSVGPDKFYFNKKTDEQREKWKEEMDLSLEDEFEEDEDLLEESSSDDDENENYFDYLPNELVMQKKFSNPDLEDIV